MSTLPTVDDVTITRWLLLREPQEGSNIPDYIAIFYTFEDAFAGWEARMREGDQDFYVEEWILGTIPEEDTHD